MWKFYIWWLSLIHSLSKLYLFYGILNIFSFFFICVFPVLFSFARWVLKAFITTKNICWDGKSADSIFIFIIIYVSSLKKKFEFLSFCFRCLGVLLQKVDDKAYIRNKIDLMYNQANISFPTNRLGLAKAMGLVSWIQIFFFNFI